MTAWIIVGSAVCVIVLGVLVLNGWRSAQYRHPLVAGWGGVAVGCGLALDGLPKLLGWSAHTGLAMATAGGILVVCGAAAQAVGGLTRKNVRPKRDG
ncbi:hypothetical protein SAMN05216267_103128 [Actinacidiphila rubida]|uniref:Uncharacterized protein n=1 Tax=Actinacidiphila rubida TaxID=310780 RepID=A0A1H8QSC8_9ACTN|nr:hypothetical protein [Actinacidiphila rubida]SEO57112.1 hypothetical protein SAMN05216267_103128 [Actinacidiphila rubida]